MEKATAVPSAKASVVQIEIRQAAVARRFLGMLEHVADATNGMDERARRVMVHFAAQAINMDVHDVGRGINPHTPDVVQNHRASYHTAFVAAEILQQRKFLRGQLQQVVAPSRFTTYEVKLQ